MGKIRKKADAVLAQGIDDRGYWEPNGAPLNVYNWFYANSGSNQPLRENFCHFWRIVMIWSPLLWLLELGEKYFSSPKRAIGTGIAAAVALIALLVFLGVTVDWSIPLVPVGMAAFIGFIVTGAWSADNYETSNVAKWAGRTVAGIIILAAGTLIVAGVIAGISAGGFWNFIMWVGITLGVIIGGGILLLCIGVGVSFVIDQIKSYRIKKHNERARWEFENPEEAAKLKPAKVRKDTKFKRFLHGVGDFATLIVQVVKVNKWKICPIVTIERPAEKDDLLY